MNYLKKYKLFLSLIGFLGLATFSWFMVTNTAFADKLTYSIACKDGSSAVTVSKNNQKHETTVRCKSGAKFDYSAGDAATATITGVCPGSEKPGTEVDEPNKPTSKIIFYCVRIAGNGNHGSTTRTDSTPNVNHAKATPKDDPNGGVCDDACTDIGSEFDPTDCADGLEGDCQVLDIVKLVAKVFAAMAATVIVAMIIVAGIQYSMAGAEASKVQAAKGKIVNALIALLLLIFGFSLIQWLVPGGLI